MASPHHTKSGAEVLYGVISADPEAFLALELDWMPSLPARGRHFKVIDLLTAALLRP